MKQYTILFCICMILFWWIIYADTGTWGVHTIREYIEWKIGEGPYRNDLIAWNEDNPPRLRLMRTWTEDWVGDYLLWSYFDQAFGKFTFPDSWSNRVQITNRSYDCDNEWFNGKMFTGQAESEIFWPVSFDDVYICIPEEAWQIESPDAIIWWYIESSMIGRADISITIGSSWFQIEEGWPRGLKVIGLVSSQNFTALDDAQLSEIRVLGNISKFELRTLMHRNVASITRNLTWGIDASWTITNLSWDRWQWVTWRKLMNNSVKYFRNTLTWDVPRVKISWNNLTGNKTLVVDWSDVYITGNITWDGILGIIALQRNGRWGNIYIDNSVTDIHAFIYADRSLISVRDNPFELLHGWTDEEILRDQLYIKWVLFSENTIWWTDWWEDGTSFTCPFYVHSNCDFHTAAKYDLNYLRRYYMAEDEDWDPVPSWYTSLWISGRESDLENYSVIIEYDNRIIHTPPRLFTQ